MSFGLIELAIDTLIVELIQQNYLNEERFAQSYARGKFRIKKWGKSKIRFELIKRGVTEYCIQKAFEEISDEEYYHQLRLLAISLFEKSKQTNLWMKKRKIASQLIRKGYESQMVWEILKESE